MDLIIRLLNLKMINLQGKNYCYVPTTYLAYADG